MKKILTFCLVALSYSAFAQLPINVGIKAGANYSLINTDGSGISTAGNASYLGGAFVRLKIKKLSIQTEGLLVGVRGTLERDATLLTPKTKDEISIGNLDIPLLVGYEFLDLKAVKFKVNGGIVQSIHVFGLSEYARIDYKGSYTSGVIGISCDIPLLLFDLRYQQTFDDFATYYPPITGRNDGFSNGLISFSVAWKII